MIDKIIKSFAKRSRNTKSEASNDSPLSGLFILPIPHFYNAVYIYVIYIYKCVYIYVYMFIYIYINIIYICSRFRFPPPWEGIFGSMWRGLFFRINGYNVSTSIFINKELFINLLPATLLCFFQPSTLLLNYPITTFVCVSSSALSFLQK